MDEPGGITESPQAQLEELLLSLFADEELARLVSHEMGEEVLSSIAWGRARATVVHELVQRIEARGLIDRDFFQALLRQRGNRRADVQRVARQWQIVLPESEPEPASESQVKDPSAGRRDSPPRQTHGRSERQQAGTWAVGGLLLVLSALVFALAPEHLPSYKLEMIRHLVALVVGVGVAFMAGHLTLRWKARGLLVQASSGVAAWVLALLTWRASPLAAPADAQAQTHAPSPQTAGASASPADDANDALGEAPSSSSTTIDPASSSTTDGNDADHRRRAGPKVGKQTPSASAGSPPSTPPAEPPRKPRWTVAAVGSVVNGADDGKHIELKGPALPEKGRLRLAQPIGDGRSFASDVLCTIQAGPTPWCMVFSKPGNDRLRAGDVLELVSEASK